MYMLIMYDVNAKRTHRFRKVLRRYLNHTQYSVFSGDLKESEATALRHEIAQLMIPEDRVVEITSENRHNVAVHHFIKHEKGGITRECHREHKQDFSVL